MAGHPGHTSEREIEIGQEISLVIPDQGRPTGTPRSRPEGGGQDGGVRFAVVFAVVFAVRFAVVTRAGDVWEDDVPPTSGPLISGRTAQDGACRRS
jgi:hypothetical protein